MVVDRHGAGRAETETDIEQNRTVPAQRGRERVHGRPRAECERERERVALRGGNIQKNSKQIGHPERNKEMREWQQ